MPDGAAVVACLRDAPESLSLSDLARQLGVTGGTRFLHHLRGLVLSGEVAPVWAARIRSGGRIPATARALVLPGGRGARLLDDSFAGRVGLRGPFASTLAPGDVVLVRLGERQAKRMDAWVLGRLEQASGTTPDLDACALFAAHGLPVAFCPQALADAGACVLPHGPTEDEADLRDLPFVTIDGTDAQDFDDAVWATRTATGLRAMVAIADVARHVAPGSPLDQAARERGQSLYGPGQVVPMLPARLSDDLCSLRPGADRPCLFVELCFDTAGQTTERRIGRGWIRSARRLTYEMAEAVLDGTTSGSAPIDASLQALRAVDAVLQASERERGALGLAAREITFVPEPGAPGGFRPCRRPRLRTHGVIERLMVAVNAVIARCLSDAGGGTAMFRHHPLPSPHRRRGLARALAGLGRWADSERTLTWADMTALARGSDDDPAVQALLLRAQARATYAAVPGRHAGLGLKVYTHATSPIRRYADLVVQRALFHVLAGLAPVDADRSDGAALAAHLNARERAGQDAMRALADRHIFAYLRDKTDTTLTGSIGSMSVLGLSVELCETGVTGVLPSSALPSDSWTIDERHQRLIARSSGVSFPWGTRVHVRPGFGSGGCVVTLVPAPGPFVEAGGS
nr:ribonuclease R family protein [Ameyamaea chiangmaiensis]